MASNYSEGRLKEIWNKGHVISNKDKELYRKDDCGNEIYWSSYGKQSDMGWEVDHIKPESKEGSNNLRNLRPLHHEENARKGNAYPYHC